MTIGIRWGEKVLRLLWKPLNQALNIPRLTQKHLIYQVNEFLYMVLNSNSTKAVLGSRVAALEILYSLYILQRWEACWGLSKALSLTGNQASLFYSIGCSPVSGGSDTYFSQKLEILINRKHTLDHENGAAAIKFFMSNTRDDFCFYVE